MSESSVPHHERLRFTRFRCTMCQRRAGVTGLRRHGTWWLCWRCESLYGFVLLNDGPWDATRMAQVIQG